MNNLDRLLDRLAVGAEIECIANTRAPQRVGMRWTVDRPQKKSVRMQGPRGDVAWMALPTRTADVEWLAADTARWPLLGIKGSDDTSDAHLVTYRFLPSSGTGEA